MANLAESNTTKSKRIAKNTLILYFRMLFLMMVSLYTSRVILDALGVEDYGIYNVVGGFVAMFSLISAALSGASSRFLSYEMGKSDSMRQNVVFSTSIVIQWSLAIIIFLVAEIFGVWYVNNIMVIPEDRLCAANWCFQFSIFNFCINLITVPYNASIIAHEKMKAFAYVSIYEGIAKLIISYLVFYDCFDRLIFYAFMLLLVQYSVQYSYRKYCKRNFEECHFQRNFDRILLKQMLNYSVWHLIGNGSVVLKTHGVNVLINLFYGPVINAARGLAINVESAVSQFVSNFSLALNPQIIQSYAKGDLHYMESLVIRGAKFSFFLALLLTCPLIINADYILGIWLKKVPEYTVIFTQLTLFTTLISSLSKTIIVAQNATGNVRAYQIVVGVVLLFNLPISYIFLSLNYSPEIIFVVAFILEFVALVARIIMTQKTLNGFNAFCFIKKVMIPCFLVAIISLPIPLALHYQYKVDFVSFVANAICSIFIISLVAIFVGFSESERNIVKNQIYIRLKLKK